MPPQVPYEMLGGEAGVRRLAHTFYEVMDELPEARPIRAMHAQDLEPVKESLFQFLSGWLGGPPLYFQAKGTVCLSSPHRPYAIGPEERDQWLLCMEEALKRIDASDQLREMLRQPLFQLADVVRNRDSSKPRKLPDNIIATG